MVKLAQNCSPPGYLFVVPWHLHHVGGVNEVVHRLHDQLRDRHGYSPLVFIPDWEKRRMCHEKVAGEEVFSLRLQGPTVRRSFRFKERLTYWVRRPFAIRQLLSLLKDRNVTIVNAHFPTPSLEYFARIKSKRLHDFRFILTFHGSDLVALESSLEYANQMHRALVACDAVIAPSLNLADRLRDLMPEIAPKINTI